jgi:predicted small lipoprotein YifL
MKQLILASAAAALLTGLAACGDTGSAPAGKSAAKHIRIRNDPHEELLALPDRLRRIGLLRAIRDTGNRCPKRVEPNPVYQGDYRGMALWTARCDNNRQYAVFIAPNEDVQVRRCEDMAQLGLPTCRPLPEARPDPPRPRPRPKAG